MNKLVILVVAFLLVGAYMIKTAIDLRNANINTTDSTKNFWIEYFKWLFHVGKNVKEVTGYAMEKDWLPDVNATNKSISELNITNASGSKADTNAYASD